MVHNLANIDKKNIIKIIYIYGFLHNILYFRVDIQIWLTKSVLKFLQKLFVVKY